MNKYDVRFKIATTSQRITATGRDTAVDMVDHVVRVEAGNSKTAEKRAAEVEDNLHNRKIRVLGVIKVDEEA
jgi:hypothetical protein